MAQSFQLSAQWVAIKTSIGDNNEFHAQREHSNNMGSFITLAFDQFEFDDSTSRVS